MALPPRIRSIIAGGGVGSIAATTGDRGPCCAKLLKQAAPRYLELARATSREVVDERHTEWPPRTVTGFMPSSRTVTALRSMSGGPRSCWRQQTVSADVRFSKLQEK